MTRLVRNSIRRTLWSAALGVLWLSALAPPAGASTIRADRLQNGLEVLLKPEPGHQAVSVVTVYRVGSRDEGNADAGYAHLLEHVMSTGTEQVADFMAAVEALGGLASALTRRDFTLFQIDAPAGALDRVLEIEADRMRGLVLSEPTIQAAVDEITAELTRTVYNAPEQFVRARLEALAFAGHPYGSPPLGSTGTTEPVTASRCRVFYDRFYRPDNACLVIAGGFDPESVRSQIEATFGALEPGGTQRAAVAAPPPLSPASGRRESVDLGAGYPAVAIAYRVPGAASTDAGALRLLTAWLRGPGRADWIPDSLDNGLAQTHVDLQLEEAAGLLVISTTLHGGDPGEVADTLLASVAAAGTGLEKSGGPNARLDPLRERVTFESLARQVTMAGRARALAEAHVLSGNHTGAMVQTFGDIEIGELAALAGRVLLPDGAVTVIVEAGSP